MKGNKCRPVPTPTADAYHAGLVLDEKLWFDPKTKTLHYDWDSECERFVRFQCGNFGIHIEHLNGDNPVERLFLVDYQCKNARASYSDFVLQREVGSVPLTKEYVQGWVDRIKRSLEEPSSQASSSLSGPTQASPSTLTSRSTSYLTISDTNKLTIAVFVCFALALFVFASVVKHARQSDRVDAEIYELTKQGKMLEGELRGAYERFSNLLERHDALVKWVDSLQKQMETNEQQMKRCAKQTNDIGELFEFAWKTIKQQ